MKDVQSSGSEVLQKCSMYQLKMWWSKEWEHKYRMFIAGRWSWQDYADLVQHLQEQINEGGVVDEQDIDWSRVLSCFSEKGVDLKRVRNSWLALRRKMPLYMLNDIESVASWLQIKYLPSKLKFKGGDSDAEAEVENDSL